MTLAKVLRGSKNFKPRLVRLRSTDIFPRLPPSFGSLSSDAWLRSRGRIKTKYASANVWTKEKQRSAPLLPPAGHGVVQPPASPPAFSLVHRCRHRRVDSIRDVAVLCEPILRAGNRAENHSFAPTFFRNVIRCPVWVSGQWSFVSRPFS